MSLDALAEILRSRTGIDAASLGPGALASAVRARRQGLSDAGLAAYAAEVERDPRARAELLSELLVHETSFFRYPAVFPALVEHLQARRAAGVRPLRVLSAPCSTGQEPASVMMALLEAGVPPSDVVLDALDLSPGVVARAREGLYTALELRGLSEERRTRHMRPEPGGWRLVPEVLASVRWAVGDLLEPSFGMGSRPYDAILCRNLLIYLTAEARRRLLDTLRRILAPEGLLFLGHAEVLPARAQGFAPAGPPEIYAVREAASPARPSVAAPRGPEPRELAALRAAAPTPLSAQPPSGPTPSTAEPVLAAARRLLHAGDAEEALRVLAAEERAGRARVEHHHLMAVLARALDRGDEAQRALERALTLEPRHAPSLRLAALVAREDGDPERAAQLEARAERAEAAAPPGGGGSA